MNKEEIQKFLPHRDPMLLVDSMEVDGSGVCHALYRVPEHPFYCEGHFPGNPIVPGVILCEMMAQASSGLYPEAFDGGLVVYRGMEQVKFRHEVHPGDLCETRATLVEHKGSLYVCETTLSVGGSGEGLVFAAEHRANRQHLGRVDRKMPFCAFYVSTRQAFWRKRRKTRPR